MDGGGNWAAIEGKYVSPKCFADPGLQKFATQNLVNRPCSFTGRRGAAPLEDVVRRIRQGLELLYDEIQNAGLAWDNEEQEYIGTTWSTQELVEEQVEIADDTPWDLIETIVEGLPDQAWCETDPYGATERQVLTWGWERFVELVKHQRRFFFHDDEVNPEDRDVISAPMLFERLRRGCDEAGLFRTLDKGTEFYRCRARKPRERFKAPREMGPPPKQFASQNRMSPAGIPMLYAAKSKNTAKSETLEPGQCWAMAKFQLLKDMLVLDLTNVPYMSLFDDQTAHLHEWWLFLMRFLRDFSASIKDRDSVHISYIPTQVITEYFRVVARWEGQPIEGIIYRSAKDDRGTCYVLFMDETSVATDEAVGGVDSWMPDPDPIIKMLSLRHHRPAVKPVGGT